MGIYFCIFISTIYASKQASKQFYQLNKETKNIYFNMDNAPFLHINKAN